MLKTPKLLCIYFSIQYTGKKTLMACFVIIMGRILTFVIRSDNTFVEHFMSNLCNLIQTNTTAQTNFFVNILLTYAPSVTGNVIQNS